MSEIQQHELWGSNPQNNSSPIHNTIEWMYPNIYDKEEKEKSHIDLYLSHVRAADPIRIMYDGGRDGWVIQQASKFCWEVDDEVCDMDWQEVAFIQAWARERE